MEPTPQPYGVQQAPAFDPRAGKLKGSTAPKVWGIILIIVGGLALANGLMSIIGSLNPAFGTGLQTSQMDAEEKREFDALMEPFIESTTGSPIHWIGLILGILFAAYSLWVGIQLVRSKPGSWRLATIRAAVAVLVMVPIEVWNGMNAADAMKELQDVMMASSGSGGPPPEIMSNVMSAAMWGMIVAMAVGSIIMNSILMVMMNKADVKHYLDSGAGRSDVSAYNVHMGMAAPPPNQPPPNQSAPPPPQY